MDRFPNKQKAIDLALWQNHSYRYEDNYGVVLSSQGDYLVVQTDHPTFETSAFESLPKDYSKMDYNYIQQLSMDETPLYHWKSIMEALHGLHGEVLQFILSSKLPLEKFIRYELACREYDREFEWVGFEKAKEIWLK